MIRLPFGLRIVAKKTKKRAVSTGSGPAVTIRMSAGKSVKASGVWNISLGGVFLGMLEPLAFGAEAAFEFALGPGNGTVRCKGFVIWSTKDTPEKGNGNKGIAVRLTDLALSEMRSISDVVGRDL